MILGISPGTITFGYAVLDNNELIDWGTSNYTDAWSKDKLDKILESFTDLIERYNICSVAIKVPDILPKNTASMQLLGALNILLQIMAVKWDYYTLSEIKASCAGNEKITSRDLMVRLLVDYPELMKSTSLKSITKNPYFVKLFEAVGAAKCMRVRTNAKWRS